MANKLDMSLDEVMEGARGGGGPTRNGKSGRRNTSTRRDTTKPYSRSKEGTTNAVPPSLGGYNHVQGASIQDIAHAPADQRVLKVGAESVPTKVAGSICHIARAGDPPALLPLGASAVNQAIKGIAMARKFMKDDNVYLYCQPEFRDGDHTRKVVTLHVMEARHLKQGDLHETELSASKTTSPEALAGAIAGKIRNNETHSIVAIGDLPVANATYAVAMARQYLEQDKIDVFMVPVYVYVHIEGEEKTAMKLKIFWANYGTDIGVSREPHMEEMNYNQERQPRARRGGGGRGGGRGGGVGVGRRTSEYGGGGRVVRGESAVGQSRGGARGGRRGGGRGSGGNQQNRVNFRA